MTTAKAKFKCPDCDKEFDDQRALGPHRAKAHGYKAVRPPKVYNPGSASAKLAGEFPCPHCDFVAKWQGGLVKHLGAKHRPANAPQPKISGPPFQCPDCDASFKAPTGLGVHRRNVHGVIGSSKSAVKFREIKGSEIVKVTKDVASPAAHTSNGHAPAAQDDHRLEAAATYAAGRVAQLLEGVALQFEIPIRALTSLVLRTVGETAKVR